MPLAKNVADVDGLGLGGAHVDADDGGDVGDDDVGNNAANLTNYHVDDDVDAAKLAMALMMPLVVLAMMMMV